MRERHNNAAMSIVIDMRGKILDFILRYMDGCQAVTRDQSG